MSQSTTRHEKGTQNIQYSGHQNSRLKSISLNEEIEKYEIINTPFLLVGTPKKGYFVALGQYIVIPEKDSIDEMLTYLDNNIYKIVLDMMLTVTQIMQNQKLNDKMTENKEE